MPSIVVLTCAFLAACAPATAAQSPQVDLVGDYCAPSALFRERLKVRYGETFLSPYLISIDHKAVIEFWASARSWSLVERTVLGISCLRKSGSFSPPRAVPADA